MAEAKTKPTGASVKAYLDAIEDVTRRKDCKAIATLMKRVTGCAPKMWGPSIVGFGSYHYEYASGHSGDMCLAGFSSRGRGIVVYLVVGEGARRNCSPCSDVEARRLSRRIDSCAAPARLMTEGRERGE